MEKSKKDGGLKMNESLFKIKWVRTRWYHTLYEKIKRFYYKKRYGITCNCPCHFEKGGFMHCWIDCCDTPNLSYKEWRTVSHTNSKRFT